MKFAPVFHCLTALVLLIAACQATVAQADITISTAATLNVSGHLLNGALFEFEGTIANGTTWDELSFSPGFFQAPYASSSLTISGATGGGASYNGNYLLEQPSLSNGFSTTGPIHWDSLHLDATLTQWTNGTDVIQFYIAFIGDDMGLTDGDVVTTSDFSDNIASEDFAEGVLGHISGPNSFDVISGPPSQWTGATFAVPEPSTAGLMLLGGAGLVFVRRRQR